MIGLDTNVIVRYLTQDDPEQTPRAIAAIESLTPDQPGFIATTTVAEVYWVLTRARYRVAPEQVVDSLEALAQSDEIAVESPGALAAGVAGARAGADFADALIAYAARRSGARRILTFDRRAAGRLGFELI